MWKNDESKNSCRNGKVVREEKNLEKWHETLSARDRRILMTKWTAEAWRELSKNKEFFKRLFEKTGCLLTAGG